MADDRRNVELRLTDEGLRVYHDIEAMVLGVEGEVLGAYKAGLEKLEDVISGLEQALDIGQE